ncbi:hypothetical protein HOK021_73560 [Streptomyces hygroscopicus]|nr:hypothetical protein HOK021_73560 [Streptomyces hygroscopicus]
MTSIRLMDSDPGKAERTAAAVQRALEASPEVVVGDVSAVPNRRGPGRRVYREVLLLEPRDGVADKGQEVTVERADSRPKARRRSGSQGADRRRPGAPQRCGANACWMLPFEAVPKGSIPSGCSEN